NDTVEAEQNVHEHDLHHDDSESGRRSCSLIALGTVAFAFEFMVNLAHRLPNQEQSTEQQNDVLPAQAEVSFDTGMRRVGRLPLLERPWNGDKRVPQTQN